MNTTITVEVPKGKEKDFQFAFSRIARNYSIEQIEDMFLNSLIEENKKDNDFVTREEMFELIEKKLGK